MNDLMFLLLITAGIGVYLSSKSNKYKYDKYGNKQKSTSDDNDNSGLFGMFSSKSDSNGYVRAEQIFRKQRNAGKKYKSARDIRNMAVDNEHTQRAKHRTEYKNAVSNWKGVAPSGYKVSKRPNTWGETFRSFWVGQSAIDKEKSDENVKIAEKAFGLAPKKYLRKTRRRHKQKK